MCLGRLCKFHLMERVVIFRAVARISIRRRIFIHSSYVLMNFVDNDCVYAYSKMNVILSILLSSSTRLLAMALCKFLVQSKI